MRKFVMFVLLFIIYSNIVFSWLFSDNEISKLVNSNSNNELEKYNINPYMYYTSYKIYSVDLGVNAIKEDDFLREMGIENLSYNFPTIVLRNPFNGEYFQLDKNIYSKFLEASFHTNGSDDFINIYDYESKNKNLLEVLKNLEDEIIEFDQKLRNIEWRYWFDQEKTELSEEEKDSFNFIVNQLFKDKIGSEPIFVIYYNFMSAEDYFKNKLKFNVYYICEYEKKDKTYRKSIRRSVPVGFKIDCGDGDLVSIKYDGLPFCEDEEDTEECYEEMKDNFKSFFEKYQKEYEDLFDEYKNSIKKFASLSVKLLLANYFLNKHLGLDEYRRDIKIPEDVANNLALYFISQIFTPKNNGSVDIIDSLKNQRLSDVVNSILYKNQNNEFFFNLNYFMRLQYEQFKYFNTVNEDSVKKFLSNFLVDLNFYNTIVYLKYNKNDRYLNLLVNNDYIVKDKDYYIVFNANALRDYGFIAPATPSLVSWFYMGITEKEYLPFLVEFFTNAYRPSERSLIQNPVGYVYFNNLFEKVLLYEISKDLQERLDNIKKKVDNFKKNKKILEEQYKSLTNFCTDESLRRKIDSLDKIREMIRRNNISRIYIDKRLVDSLNDFCSMYDYNIDIEYTDKKIEEEVNKLFKSMENLQYERGFLIYVDKKISDIESSKEFVFIEGDDLKDKLLKRTQEYYNDILTYLNKYPKIKEKVLNFVKENYPNYFIDIYNLRINPDNFDVKTHVRILVDILSFSDELTNHLIKNNVDYLNKLLKFYEQYYNSYLKDKDVLKVDIPKDNFNDIKKRMECYTSRTLTDSKLKNCGIDCSVEKKLCIMDYISNDIALVENKLNQIDLVTYKKFLGGGVIKKLLDTYISLIKGDIKYECKLSSLKELSKYYNSKNILYPFRPKWGAVFNGETNKINEIGHYKELIDKFKNLDDELKNCKLKVEAKCTLTIGGSIDKNGKVKTLIKIYTPDVKSNKYYSNEYFVDPVIAKFFNINPIQSSPINKEKEITIKLYNIYDGKKELDFELSNQFKTLKEKCSIRFNGLFYYADTKNLKSENDGIKRVLPNGIEIKRLVSFFIPKMENIGKIKDNYEKNYCIYSTRFIEEKDEKYFVISINDPRNKCLLPDIQIDWYKDGVEIFYGKRKIHVKSVDGKYFIPFNKYVVGNTKYKFKVIFPNPTDYIKAKLDKRKKEKEIENEVKRNINRRDKTEMNIIKKIDNECNDKELSYKYMSVYLSYKNEIERYNNIRPLLLKIEKVSKDRNVIYYIEKFFEDYKKSINDLYNLRNQLRKDVCDGKISFENVKNSLKKLKDDLENIKKYSKIDYKKKQEEIREIKRKAKQFYDLTEKLYKLTKDEFYKKKNEEFSTYTVIDLKEYRNITLEDYYNLLVLYYKINPYSFNEVINVAIRKFETLYQKNKDEKVEKYYNIYKNKEGVEKVKYAYFEKIKDLGDMSMYEYLIKKMSDKNIVNRVEKEILKNSLSILENEVKKLKTDKKTKKKLTDLVRDIKNDIDNNKLNDAKKKIDKLKKDLIQIKKSRNLENDNTIFLIVFGSLPILFIIGVIGYYYYRKKKNNKKKENNEEDEDSFFDIDEDEEFNL